MALTVVKASLTVSLHDDQNKVDKDQHPYTAKHHTFIEFFSLFDPHNVLENE